MVRPHHFAVNPQTQADNLFQSRTDRAPADIAESAYRECTSLADALRAKGVHVHLVEDDATDRPDSVFPNNWFSTDRKSTRLNSSHPV